jgi:hypothetical protein
MRPSTKENKPKYKVRNWKEYNASLCARGSLEIFINPEIVEQWKKLSKKKAKWWANKPIQIVLSNAVF